MLANFTFKKYKDRYYLESTGSIPLNYVIEQNNSCSNDYTLVPGLSGTLSGEIEIIFPEDGAYRLSLSRGSDSQIIFVKNYLRLQKELIYNMIKLLCTKNELCPDCNETDTSQQALFSELLGYQFLIKPYTEDYCDKNCLFDQFLYKALEQSSCDIQGRIFKELTKQLYTGKVEVDSFSIRIFAAIYFSAFYYFEHMTAVDQAEKTFVDEKFSWARVQYCMRKYINCFSDIEGIYVGVSAICNDAPSVGNVTREFHDLDWHLDPELYTFVTLDFTTGYTDPQGDLPKTVKLLNNAFRGTLLWGGNPISGENFTFDISQVSRLQFRFIIEETNPQFDRFFFQISDNNISPKFSNMATITISVTEYINQPPDEVGDNSFTLANRAVKVFTLADFTTTTTPPYHDPENDPVQALRIDTLPSAGLLRFNGSNCTAGQIILAVDITAGLFSYVSPDQNNTASTDWDFSVRDSGSMQFRN